MTVIRGIVIVVTTPFVTMAVQKQQTFGTTDIDVSPPNAHEIPTGMTVTVVYRTNDSFDYGKEPNYVQRTGVITSKDFSDNQQRMMTVEQSNGREVVIQTFPDLRENGVYSHLFSVWKDGSQHSLGPIDDIEVR